MANIFSPKVPNDEMNLKSPSKNHSGIIEPQKEGLVTRNILNEIYCKKIQVENPKERHYNFVFSFSFLSILFVLLTDFFHRLSFFDGKVYVNLT